MVIAGIEFPDKCPTDCPEKGKPFDQGDACTRCPIFNCTPFDYPDPDTDEVYKMSMVEPDEYREDWAKEWKKWFDAGMKGLPNLRFTLEKEKK
jgi:hypothetical protein